MSEQTNTELIAEARTATLQNDYERAYHGGLVERLAERLEAADQRAAEYAAVMEKVRELPRYSVPDPVTSWRAVDGEDLDHALADIPADVLRELKADVWDEGHSWGWSDAQEAHDVRQEMERSEWKLCTLNPYRKEPS